MEVFPLDMGSTDEDDFPPTCARPLKRGSRISKPVLKPRTVVPGASADGTIGAEEEQLAFDDDTDSDIDDNTPVISSSDYKCDCAITWIYNAITCLFA